MQAYSDEELVDVFRKKKNSQGRKAFDCLYSRYSKKAIQYFYFAFHNDYDKAKDFVQDLFLKILESPEKIDSDKKFKYWLFRVASNMSKNEFRREGVEKKYADYVKTTSTDYSWLKEEEKKLSNSIRKLSQEQRSLIVLRFKINLTIKEIATILQCPEGTVKSRLFYATKELKKHYKR